MKGQSIIFEQMLLFSISIVIFLVSISAFNIYQNFFLEVGRENQLDQTTDWIAGHILKLSQKGSTANSFTIIPIPREIGGAVYKIKLNQDTDHLSLLNLLTNEQKISSLYTLNETFRLSGEVNSLKGRITIKKEGDQIIIV